MAVSVHLKQFDGPLDLLLTLIGKAKIDLQEIFVSDITEQYIEIVQNAADFDMEEASEFISMAALLVEIKSRHLLPKPPKEEEEDPEQALIPAHRIRGLQPRRYRPHLHHFRAESQQLLRGPHPPGPDADFHRHRRLYDCHDSVPHHQDEGAVRHSRFR